MTFRSRSYLSLALALGLMVGCAQERSPLNRVQSDVLKKSFFVGDKLDDPSDDPEFYSRATVVDVGYGAQQDGLFTSSWGQTQPGRVKFVIQERLLVARLTYERIEDSDGKGAGGPASSDGVIVAVYPIESHFDIKRSYNPTTGEQMNVTEENTSDRPWYQREYMRIDFSQNLNVDSYDFDTLSLIGAYGSVQYEPLAYYVNDPASEDAPHIDEAQGYLDITNKAFAKPKTIDLPQWGVMGFPACFLFGDIAGGTNPSGTCNPVEITVRHSFRRVTDTDYEPADWDGIRFRAYGAFTTDRKGYARNYGMTDALWHRFISRYNIWERSHYYDDLVNMTGPVECNTPETTPVGADPNRDEKGDIGTADECESVTGRTIIGLDGQPITIHKGSQCDPFKQRCTLPYRDRQEKTIVWYYSTDSDPNYFEGTEWATQDWDVALRWAVVSSRYAECNSTKDDRCAWDYALPYGQMDETEDAVALATEVDACRNGKAYLDQRSDCKVVADQIGAQRGYSNGVIALAKAQEMIVLCHSPVERGDPEQCGTSEQRLPAELTAEKCVIARRNRDWGTLATCNAALNARRGDLRYHMVHGLTTPQVPSAWGIMMDADDPLTGEKVSASINIWTYINDMWSQTAIDVARYMKKELTTSEITEGTYVANWSSAAERAADGVLPKMSRANLDQRLAGVLGTNVETLNAAKNLEQYNPGLFAKVKNFDREVRAISWSATAPAFTPMKADARRKLALDTPLEAELTTKMMQQAFSPTQLDPDTAMKFASPLRGADPRLARYLEQAKELALAQRGGCMLSSEAPVPLGIANLADKLEEKFGKFNPNDNKSTQFQRAEAMRKYVAQVAQKSVIVHEMGHSMALRHNFVSSSDALGFRPQYWQLRTRNGAAAAACVTGDGEEELQQTADGNSEQPGWNNCSGPRYYDPLSEEEKQNLIWMFMQSSTMDYAGETTQDLLGLGVYDFAATRMFYGDVASVYSDAVKYGIGSERTALIENKIDDFGGIIGWNFVMGQTSPQAKKIHYSRLQEEFGMIEGCSGVDPNLFKPATWDEAKYGTWDPLLDGHIVKVGNQYTRCKQPQVDYVQWKALSNPPYATRTGHTMNYVDCQTDEDCKKRDSVFGDDAVCDLDPQSRTNGKCVLGGHPKTADDQNRLRVPYGFGTDSWADLGNIAVYRHDNGADPYELFDFFISQQETNHIFDNYRRGRLTFNIRSASQRGLTRYNAKMRDGAKGLSLMANVYKDFALESGIDFKYLWPIAADYSFKENILASAIAFDYFTMQMQRPEIGNHTLYAKACANDSMCTMFGSTADKLGKCLPISASGSKKVCVYKGNVCTSDSDCTSQHCDEGYCRAEVVLRSDQDITSNDPGPTVAVIPNGVVGSDDSIGNSYRNAWIGGRLLENKFCERNKCGEYFNDYTMNCGTYYDKLYTSMLMTESVDNFVSASRRDFSENRYRAVSLADLFPEGYRRWLANNLTGDDFIKGPRLAADPALFLGAPSGNALPSLDSAGYPSSGIGWTTWLTEEPQTCFPSDKALMLPGSTSPVQCVSDSPLNTVAIDPQIGWEQQKFLIAWTMQYLPENQMQTWLDMLYMWELGADSDPGIDQRNRIELHDPNGKVFIAHTFGKESIFGKKVQKGVSARILEYANELLAQAYVVDPAVDGGGDVIDNDGDGKADWWLPRYVDGLPVVKYDPSIVTNTTTCSATDNSGCVCSSNRACVALERYIALPIFLRQAMAAYGLAAPSMRGIY